MALLPIGIPAPVSSVRRQALVAYSALEMFELVDNIDAYAEFLPWCRSARVLSRTDDEVRATVEIAHGALHKSFTTLNRVQKGKMIEMRLVEGPFRHLEGYWRFDSLGERACKVTLDLEFEFSTRLVDAFCKRAEQVYGRNR